MHYGSSDDKVGVPYIGSGEASHDPGLEGEGEGSWGDEEGIGRKAGGGNF